MPGSDRSTRVGPSKDLIYFIWSSVSEPESVDPKLFGDLEPEPKINFNKHILQSVWRMLG